MRFISPLAVFAVLAASTLAAHGDSIYSNFGPGKTYDTLNRGYDIGTVQGINQLIAIPFIPTETVTLTDGGVPEILLDTLGQVGSIKTLSPSLVDFTCSPCSVLDAGTTYFLVAQQSGGSSLSGSQPALRARGTIYDNADGSRTGQWDDDPNGALGAFEVNGTAYGSYATPEPSSLFLLGAGLLCAAGMARWKFYPS